MTCAERLAAADPIPEPTSEAIVKAVGDVGFIVSAHRHAGDATSLVQITFHDDHSQAYMGTPIDVTEARRALRDGVFRVWVARGITGTAVAHIGTAVGW